ncbi:DUF4230 domain-containing protein [Sandaracinobacter sp. RS1-74]|uniref:DUF4230 domain-containing protein n=1 Tax=Sandaracinobacteroides sayramensis TaxID=2913411 RepID=UPI001EDB576E|nr:DUF4230 domain-containing protein [Sandaracinobacteroides sayramensis]MCG2839587.1 DUF4230 domain-containing protein [Sandaracinobacteroides sayramensis]
MLTLRRVFAWVGVIALVLAALALAAGPQRRYEACRAIGLCKDRDFLGAMLVSVRKQNRLVVLTARLVAPVTSARDTTLGPVTVATTRQTVILPARVDYSVDLSGLAQSDLDWNADTRTLTVRRPPVEAGPPVIEWEHAQTYSDGNIASLLTDVQRNLEKDNRQKAPALFKGQAASRDLMQMADNSADDALATLFRAPLVAAGHSNPKVVVTR